MTLQQRLLAARHIGIISVNIGPRDPQKRRLVGERVRQMLTGDIANTLRGGTQSAGPSRDAAVGAGAALRSKRRQIFFETGSLFRRHFGVRRQAQ